MRQFHDDDNGRASLAGLDAVGKGPADAGPLCQLSHCHSRHAAAIANSVPTMMRMTAVSSESTFSFHDSIWDHRLPLEKFVTERHRIGEVERTRSTPCTKGEMLGSVVVL